MILATNCSACCIFSKIPFRHQCLPRHNPILKNDSGLKCASFVIQNLQSKIQNLRPFLSVAL